MIINELIERLDIETDFLGRHLKRLMEGDTSPVEAIDADYELVEGGDEFWWEDKDKTPPTEVIQSFVVWTENYIYHTPPLDDAFLYETGNVLKVRRNPDKEQSYKKQ